MAVFATVGELGVASGGRSWELHVSAISLGSGPQKTQQPLTIIKNYILHIAEKTNNIHIKRD
ncbi:hypothetical protein DY78_GL001215 [Lactiplantibacillus fabifermentans DSM 21115]|uniref:Uncharacterized protein n=1 Tax=Lactiplantibacillus fabifermentans DSM 21115 TaxID=1413187 RepID=A0A0R2NIC9_9LACO|nr:hypothetical protein DY78_GL001215 [Lactiplantibacillus fabifermentans DSM 21115]